MNKFKAYKDGGSIVIEINEASSTLARDILRKVEDSDNLLGKSVNLTSCKQDQNTLTARYNLNGKTLSHPNGGCAMDDYLSLLRSIGNAILDESLINRG